VPDASSINHVLSYTPFVTGGSPHHRVVALTFDDGPSPYTAGVVNVLVRMHVPATFFVVGQQLGDFSAGLRDELRHGFVIGDHTENHAYLTQLSAAGVYKQIHDAAARITRLGAPYPRLFRPPYGAYNSTTLSTLRQFKMLMTLWSVDTRDWTRPGTPAIVRSALSAARPGAIILMHDGGGDRSETIAALPAIINGLRRRHYELVTVPQLLKLDPPPRGQHLPHVAE
jgi:peptidoglycan/xylan/chitin deacetylase (PgdA/CDA1 family)